MSINTTPSISSQYVLLLLVSSVPTYLVWRLHGRTWSTKGADISTSQSQTWCCCCLCNTARLDLGTDMIVLFFVFVLQGRAYSRYKLSMYSITSTSEYSYRYSSTTSTLVPVLPSSTRSTVVPHIFATVVHVFYNLPLFCFSQRHPPLLGDLPDWRRLSRKELCF